MSTQHVITAAYFLSATASFVFVLRYALKRWWQTRAGILMMTFHLVMVGFGVSSTLFLMYGPHYTGRLPLALALVLGLNFVNWGWWWELERAQRGARRAQRSTPLPETHPAEETPH